ncbi:MAG: hypothetical protein K0S32_62 [Bacteroidetes bacterium]|jgi:hypothetical protein|nr:hypothetical protein [Bacteroidota bacterium]
MRTSIAFILFSFSATVFGQKNKVPKMAPVYGPGYYVNTKDDTIRGNVQLNPLNKTDFYRQFAFRLPNTSKPRIIDSKKAKAYGYNDKHFVSIEYNGEKIFVERLVTGRLRFFEFNATGEPDEEPEPVYFVRDTDPLASEETLKEFKKLSGKYYKKMLKPYMKDQLFIWSDLDKYHFNKDKVIQALSDFNKLNQKQLR